jgi:hypothetical protein
LPSWVAGLGAIGAAVGVLLWLVHFTTRDVRQQLPLVTSLASGHLVHALEGVIPPQTSGPGFGLFALPLYAVVRIFATEHTAYVTASLACLIPLAWAVIAASRALGVERRSRRELANVAVVLLGTPTMATYFEALHPADVLATAACLGAYAALARRRVAVAFVLLGFALATRQWAILAVAVLAAFERGDARRHLVLGSAGTATVLVLPFFVANAGQTISALRADRTSRGSLAAMSLFDFPAPVAYALSRYVPIVGTALLCAWLVRRRVPWSPEVAVAALAVAFLIRAPFDPAGLLYYACPGYAFFVLMGTKSWRWHVAGVTASAALVVRFMVRDRFPYARVISVFGIEGPFHAPGVVLSIATTLVFAAALVAATLNLARVAGRSAEPSVPSPAAA